MGEPHKPRVTITQRKNGRWHIGNLDDDTMRALIVMVGARSSGDFAALRTSVQQDADRIWKALNYCKV
jgi:hypothetical protein